jgi:hypothetical protein
VSTIPATYRTIIDSLIATARELLGGDRIAAR